LIPNSRLIDAPAHDLTKQAVLVEARNYRNIIIHTSSPTLRGDAELAGEIKAHQPDTLIGFVGAQAAVLPGETLQASEAIDWVGRREFDYTCVEVAQGKPLAQVAGLSFRKDGQVVHNPERALIANFDEMPSVMDVYKRDLKIENYFVGYLKHPYVSHYTGRGCPAKCTFCLWPQTIGGHRYRTRSPQSVFREMKHAKSLFPQVKEFFFDDDTFTAYQPRAREIAVRLGSLGITWSCNARANVNRETLRLMKENGLRLLLVGYETGSQPILDNIKKGVRVEQAETFTRHCRELGITIHGTFILGLPGETLQTIEETIEFAKRLDLFSIQVSLAAPYPGTELYEQAIANGWLKPGTELVGEEGEQLAALEYRDLSQREIFEAVERFYKRYYLRWTPILRMLWTMLQDGETMKRRLREGREFFQFLRLRSRGG